MFFFLPIQEGNPPKKFPLANVLLIFINVYVFIKTLSIQDYESFIRLYGFTASHVFHFQNVFTSMFLHANLLHLLGNMYFLYVFGDNVEDKLGKVNYLLAYFLSGFGAIFLQYTMAPHSTIPMIGASGAISGICALYMVMFPWQKMRLQFFFIIFPIFSIPARAFFVVGFWFLEQYLMATMVPAAAGGVAFWAHVGGFLTGVALFPFLYSNEKRRA